MADISSEQGFLIRDEFVCLTSYFRRILLGATQCWSGTHRGVHRRQGVKHTVQSRVYFGCTQHSAHPCKGAEVQRTFMASTSMPPSCSKYMTAPSLSRPWKQL